MKSIEKNNLIFIKMDPNEDIHKNIIEISKKHKIKTGIIISGIGQIKNFTLGYFNQKNTYLPTNFKKPYELLALSGNIITKQDEKLLHLHATCSDENKKTIGGHLINAKVNVTAEIVVLKTNIDITRKKNNKTGLESLYITK